MRCIVTGGAGFLGSYLTEQLVMMGHSVVVIDDMFRGKKKSARMHWYGRISPSHG